MDNSNYIKKLKRQLAPLSYKKRKDIIKEVESHIKENNMSYEQLIERFGKPEKLAKSYLEEMPTKTPIKNKFWKLFKICLAIVGVIFLLIVLFFWWYSRDEFDYSKYNGNTINEKISNWKSLDYQGEIKLTSNQTKTIIYWADSNKILYSCKKDVSIKANNLKIEQNNCYFIMPNKAINIKSTQSEIIMIEPKNSINLDIKQTTLKIAEGNKKYNYQMSGKQSKYDNFNSVKDGIKIIVKTYQAKVAHYKY